MLSFGALIWVWPASQIGSHATDCVVLGVRNVAAFSPPHTPLSCHPPPPSVFIFLLRIVLSHFQVPPRKYLYLTAPRLGLARTGWGRTVSTFGLPAYS
jgi:hypothetical protein